MEEWFRRVDLRYVFVFGIWRLSKLVWVIQEFTEREGRVVDEDNDAMSEDATFTIVSSNFTSRVECNPAPKS